MNASSPPSSLVTAEIPAPEIQPAALAAPKRPRDWGFMRPVAACGGALLVGALMVRLVPPPVTSQSATGPTVQPVAPMVVPASQLVQARLVPTKTSARMLSGEWKLTTDSVGHARASGEVARWVVEPGAHVEAGDRVVEISTGVASRSAPVVETTHQNRAERAEVEANRGQAELSQNLAIARTQLAAAQERVASAQEKVASTRTLVKRLINGEKIPLEAGTPAPRKKRKRLRHPDSEAAPASREEVRAQADAQRAKGSAESAQSDSDDAKAALADAQRAAKKSAAALSKAEADFGAEKITADVLQSARDTADEAASTLKATQTRADVAERAAASRQQKADAAQAEAQRAHRSADTAPKAASAPDESAGAPDASADARTMTAEQAAPLVASALRESKAAIRQADRVRARVAQYERQVKDTSQRVEVATQDLQSAQETVMQSVPRATFVSGRAPVAGTVTWIARLAREVGVGQPIFGLSRGQNGFLRFSDRSGAWKLLQVGQTLRAASSVSADAPENSASAPSPAMPTSGPSGSTASPNAVPAPTFSVRITHITPPDHDGGTAQIDAQSLDNAPATGEKSVQAELPAGVLPAVASNIPNSEKSVVVPASVVLPRDGASFVAVLASSGTASASSSLTWRAVQIAHETAFDVEIKSGLRDGERVVDQPILLLSQLKPEDKKAVPVVVQATS